jgi:hypothetical protein
MRSFLIFDKTIVFRTKNSYNSSTKRETIEFKNG